MRQALQHTLQSLKENEQVLKEKYLALAQSEKKLEAFGEELFEKMILHLRGQIMIYVGIAL